MRPISIIKIPDNLSDKEHQKLAEKLSIDRIDGIELSVAGGHWGATWKTDEDYNLDFLKFYKGIKVVKIILPSVTDISPILNLSETLEILQIGEFREKKISYDIIGNLSNLNYLSIARQTKGIESILRLPKLKELALTGYSIDKLSFLNNLTDLKRLYIGFGTSKNLDNISELVNLEELDILWVKQLSDINAISNLKSLIKLKIENEKQIISLPDLSKLNKLKNIRLMNLSSLENLSSLISSHLEEFILTGPNKNADMLKSISNSKSLAKVYTYFYLKKEQEKAELILGNKFQSLNKMNFEMDNKAKLMYHNIETGERIL